MLLMLADNCYLLDYNALKQLPQIPILVHLLRLYLDQHFFVFPNSFFASGDNNFNLHPVFILKTILFLILFG